MSVQFLKTPALRLHPDDDVVIALRDIAAGTAVDVAGEQVTARVAIPAAHKMAVRHRASGDLVHRYAQVIGRATTDIAPGDHVHGHNLTVGDLELDHRIGEAYTTTAPAAERATFQGIRRGDGRVATRNYLAVIATVNCSATVARAIAGEITRSGALDAFANVDGVVALTHGSGCGMDTSGEGLDVLRRTIAGYATHPNFSGVLLVGLGCVDYGMGDLMSVSRI
jgi:altronate hydrolase